MKKALSIIIVCGLLVCTAFSCGDSKKSEKSGKKSKSSAVTEENTTAEGTENTTEEKTKATTAEKTDSEEETTEKGDTEETTEEKKSGAPAENTPQLREAKECVKKYIESTLGSDAEVLFGYSYPKETIEYLKSSGKMDSLADSYASINDEGGDGSKIEDVEISDETVLSENAIKGAAVYFESMNSVFGGEPLKCSIESGYCMTLNAKITFAGETIDSSEPVSAVYIKDDGWKVIPMDAEYLESMASYGN